MFRQLNPLTILHLTFEYTNFGAHKYHVQSWVRYAINLSVSILTLDFIDEFIFDLWDDPDDAGEDSGNRACTFDFNLLDISKSRINVLELSKCDLILPPQTNPITFVFLKSLRLMAPGSLGCDDLCYLLARCVNLEILKLVRIKFKTEVGLVIHSSSLKELYLRLCSNDNDDLGLDIRCPSLQKISVKYSGIGKVINKDATNLVEACIDFKTIFLNEEYSKSWEKMLSYFTNISSIRAWEELLESQEVPAGCELFASNVKHLEFYCYYNEIDLVGVAALLKLLPKLETLVLNNRGTGDERNLRHDYRKASTVFNMPCLKKLVMRRYHKTKRAEHLIKLFKKNGIVLDKIVLLP